MTRIVILGGGPAGVGAAWRLARDRKASVALFERAGAVGGNAGSFDHGGTASTSAATACTRRARRRSWRTSARSWATTCSTGRATGASGCSGSGCTSR